MEPSAVIWCLTNTMLLEPYQQAAETPDVPQSQGDVDEHGGVANQYGADVAVALSVDLVLNAALRVEGDREVGVAVAFQKGNESEKAGEKKEDKRGTCRLKRGLWSPGGFYLVVVTEIKAQSN